MGKSAFLEKVKIGVVSALGYLIIRLICSTLRWEVQGASKLDSIHAIGRKFILTFWHGRVFMAIYHFRKRGIVAMISQNRDGEYLARVMQRFGFGTARGSSTRRSRGATMECLQAMKDGRDLGTAIDGPRGPCYVAKPGAAYLARKSGNPVLPFHIAAEKKWVMNSWDRFQVPRPFSRAIVLVGEPIYLDADANKEQINAAEAQIQSSLDELRERGDSWWSEKNK
jgi:lysophospholipid acyltransferase (LPLAT)-like uncharacterized protein